LIDWKEKMMKLRTVLVTATTAAMTLSAVTPSFAAPLALARLQDRPTLVQHVQYWHDGPRHHGYHGGHHGWHHGDYHGGHHGGYRGDHHRHHDDGNAAALIGGLAVGAIIGGAIAASQAKAENDAYCSQRFRSYDPESGTYLARGGIRRPCP
jgi:hypothetical protein